MIAYSASHRHVRPGSRAALSRTVTIVPCKAYVCDASKIWELPGLRRASIDPKLPPGTPPPGVVAKCWVNNPRRCRIAARPFRNSAGMELYADLCATIDTLNGNGKFGAQAIGNGP